MQNFLPDGFITVVPFSIPGIPGTGTGTVLKVTVGLNSTRRTVV